jgi:hypothetical protein
MRVWRVTKVVEREFWLDWAGPTEIQGRRHGAETKCRGCLESISAGRPPWGRVLSKEALKHQG